MWSFHDQNGCSCVPISNVAAELSRKVGKHKIAPNALCKPTCLNDECKAGQVND